MPKMDFFTTFKRFNDDYNAEELGRLAATARKLAEAVKEVDVVFNNSYEGQGQRNARGIAKIAARLKGGNSTVRAKDRVSNQASKA